MKNRAVWTLLALGAVATTRAADDYIFKAYHYSSSQYGSSFSTLTTADGIVYGAGYLQTSAGDADFRVVAYKHDGTVKWAKSIATDGTGLNSPRKIVVHDGKLFFAGSSWELVNGESKLALFTARLDLETGAVVWSNAVPHAWANAMAVSGNGASLRVMVAGQQWSSVNPLSRRYIVRSVNADGSQAQTFQPAEWNGSDATSVVPMTNGSFAFGILNPNGQAIVREIKNGAFGFQADVTANQNWKSLKLAAGDPAKTHLSAAIQAVGKIMTANGPSAIEMRVKENGQVIPGTTVKTVNVDPVSPVWKEGVFYTSRADTFVSGVDSIVWGTGSALSYFFCGNTWSATPAAVALDAYSKPHLVSNVFLQQGSAQTIRVASHQNGPLTYDFPANNASAFDALTDGKGLVVVAGRALANGVQNGVILQFVPKAKTLGAGFYSGFNKTITATKRDVLKNSVGVEGATVTYGNATHGMLTPDGDGGFSYKPDPGFIGVDSAPCTISALSGPLQTQVHFFVYPRIYNVSFTTPSVVGGTQAVGTVEMNGPMPTTGHVELKDNSAAASVPYIVTIEDGMALGGFTVQTVPVAANQSCVVTASFMGYTFSRTLTILAPTMKAISVTPGVVKGGNAISGTVTLTGKAAVAVPVTLFHTGNEISMPAMLTIPAGQSFLPYSGTTTPVTTNSPRTLSATANGVTKSVTLTITP